MREFKFRAWDKKEKIMRHVIDLKCDLTDSYLFTSTKKALDHVIMQYTGLKDKNGKKIYEGDIVKIDKASGYYQVHYWKDLMQFVFSKERKKGTKALTMAIDKKRRNVEDGKIKHIEVIGNIYEHPELLN